jgi:predicted PurR-regulated permease PerM
MIKELLEGDTTRETKHRVLNQVWWSVAALLVLGLISLTQVLSKELILLLTLVWLLYALLPWVDHLDTGLRRSVFRWVAPERQLMVRPLAVFIVLGLLAWLLAFQVVIQWPTLQTQWQKLSRRLPGYTQMAQQEIGRWINPNKAPTEKNKPVEATPTQTRNASLVQESEEQGVSKGWASWLEPLRSPLLSGLVSLGTNTLQGLVYILSGVVLLSYGLLDGPKLTRSFFQHYLPPQKKNRLHRIALSFHLRYKSLVQAQLVLALGSFVLFLPLYTGLNLPYAYGLAGLLGLTSLIPVLGSWLGLIPAAIVSVVHGSEGTILRFVLAVMVFIGIKHLWLKPRLMKHHRQMHPVVALIIFLACYQIIGLWSLFLAPLVQTASITLYRWHQLKGVYRKPV